MRRASPTPRGCRGFRAFFFTLKLEKCFTRAELAALLPDYDAAVKKGKDPEVARLMSQRARALLG